MISVYYHIHFTTCFTIEPELKLVTIETTSRHTLSAVLNVFILNYLTTHIMLPAILNVFILNYLTTHVVCHLECVYSEPLREVVSILTRRSMSLQL